MSFQLDASAVDYVKLAVADATAGVTSAPGWIMIRRNDENPLSIVIAKFENSIDGEGVYCQYGEMRMPDWKLLEPPIRTREAFERFVNEIATVLL